jgi:hypothetical protein
MLHPSTKKLIDRLAEMTELGKLDWTEGEDGSLIYSTEGYSVCLPDDIDEVIIQSIDGKELERAAADALAATTSDDGTSYAQIVAGMGAEAARIARGTETAISSLLAGMEEPAAPEEETIADLADDSLEDPGDEVAAMESEGIVSHQATVETAPEAKPEISVSEDTSADTAVEPEPTTERPEEIDAAPPEQTIEAEAVTIEDTSAAPVTEIEAGAVDQADEGDTESDVTEAVARLADEVNSREEVAESEMTSAVDAAAVNAVGVVASAAGLDQVEAHNTPDSDEVETATDEALTSAPLNTEAPASSYVPFGLGHTGDTPTTATAEVAPEESVSDAQQMPPEQEAAEDDVAEPVSAVAPTPDFEPAPEGPASSVTDFAATTTTESDSEPAAQAAPNDASVEAASEPESATEAEPETQTEPVSEMTSSSEPDLSDTPEPAAEPDSSIAVTSPAESAMDEETSADGPSDAQTEPVLASAEEPKTYSLSGIGAGFGLGALAAKTEASGIPGPSSAAPAEPEKIVIDATEDVLPELEGNLNVEHMEAAVSEISFGKSETAAAEDAIESEEDSDGDILKPRTRFNPWD